MKGELRNPSGDDRNANTAIAAKLQETARDIFAFSNSDEGDDNENNNDNSRSTSSSMDRSRPRRNPRRNKNKKRKIITDESKNNSNKERPNKK